MTIAELRSELAGALAEWIDIPIHEYMPSRVTAPCVILLADDPFIVNQDDDTYDSLTVSFAVQLVMATGANEKVATAMDSLIQAATSAILESESFFFVSAGGFGEIETRGAVSLGAVITTQAKLSI